MYASGRQMNNNVRKLTDGAMMTAIVGVLLLINRQSGGVLEELMLFAFPLPMVFYSAKYGLKDSWLVLAAISLLSVVLGTPQTIFYVTSEAIIGMVYGSGIHKGTDSRKLLLMTMFMGVVVNVVTTIVLAKFFGYDLNLELQEYEKMVTTAMDQAGAQMPPQVNLTQTLRTMLIVSVMLTGIIQGYVTHVLARVLLRRFRFSIPPATPAVLYFPPKWSGYVGIACLVGYYYSIYRPLANELAQGILQGAGLCGTMYLCIYGMIAVILLGKLAFPRSRFLVAIIAVMMLLSMMLPVALMGFLYITTDWHRRMLEGGRNAPENQ